MRLSIVIAWVGVLGAVCAFLIHHRGAVDAPATGASGSRAAVVVELFSSEGCSSCPPADEYVASLDHDQPIDGVTVIALEEHVDYWDRLGWRDPFGNPAFGERQTEYARIVSDHHVFTPEIVFDGRFVMPGGDEDAAKAMMQQTAREPKARVSLQRDGAKVTVDVADVPSSNIDDAPEVWLAVTESGLVTNVPAGENAGRRLAHGPVVRRLQRIGRASAGSFHTTTTLDLEPSWKPRALRVVGFVQLAKSRRIVGAATTI